MKSHSCSAVVICVLLVISALWPQNNVNPYAAMGSVRCPFGYSTGPCGCRTGVGTSSDQSCGVARGLCGAHTGRIGTIRHVSPYMKLPAICRPREDRNPNLTACREDPFDISCSIHNYFQIRASYEFRPVEGP